MSDILRVKDLKKYYRSHEKNSPIKALDGLNIALKSGEILGVIGESGCGKSTLAKVIIGLEKITSGRVLFQGIDVEDYLKRDRIGFRKNLQMVFQNPFDVFDPRIKIGRLLTSALRIHGIGNNKSERLEIVKKYLHMAGMDPYEDFIDRYPHELSGGQLQRISILRSMMLGPKIIIADEPVSMLDVSIRVEIINLLLDISKKQGNSMIFISHDIATTRYVSDRIAVMYLGKIVELGPRDLVIDNPNHPYTKALISNCGTIDPRDQLEPIRVLGEPPIPINTGPGCYFYSRCYRKTEACKDKYPETIEVSRGHFVSCLNIVKTIF